MDEKRNGVGAERNEAVGEVEFRPDRADVVGVPLPDEELEALLPDVPEPDPDIPEPSGEEPWHPPMLAGPGKSKNKRLVKNEEAKGQVKSKPPNFYPAHLTPEQKLLLLDTWKRSGLTMGVFEKLVGINKHTIYLWNKRFKELGPEGLMNRPRGTGNGSQLPDLTKRTILMLKEDNPGYGCQRISDMLARGPALAASASSVARVLHEAGYEVEETPTRAHEEVVHSFERARPNQMWQTDLFTFLLKRESRRVYLVGFIDDNSRFVVGYGLYASAPTALVLEVLRAAITSYGPPEEVLTDNGPQYVTWRGKSAFAKELEKRGIKHLVARPKRPQTLGKIERFWGSLWRECLETSVFLDIEDARQRIGHFIDHYNFHRPHQGIDGLVPADRFFQAAPEVRNSMQERVAKNALELARNGLPKRPFYVTGQVGGKTFSLHAEGERVIMTSADEGRKEVDLVAPAGEQPKMPEPVTPTGRLTEEAGTQEESPANPERGEP